MNSVNISSAARRHHAQQALVPGVLAADDAEGLECA
jgi:hypothetical protein